MNRTEVKKLGFTLIELLVTLGILSVVSALILTIFTRTLRGGNKTQIVETIKQNGQSILENMDKTVRQSDSIVCISNNTPPGPTLVVVKNGCFTRYRFLAASPAQNPTSNGLIQQDAPQFDPSTPCVQTPPSPAPAPQDIKSFTSSVCTTPMVNPNTITDTNTQTGTTVGCLGDNCNSNPFFTLTKSAGFKDQVTIKFYLKPGVQALQALAGQIDPVSFQTTINLR